MTYTMNQRRANWARLALKTFANLSGLDMRESGDGLQTTMVDMVTNMRHLAARRGIDWNAVTFSANEHFTAEHRPTCHEPGELFCDTCGSAEGSE